MLRTWTSRRWRPMWIGLVVVAAAGAAHAGGTAAPSFPRPFDGVPIPPDNRFHRILPESAIDLSGDCDRHLDVGGCPPTSLPAALPASFLESTFVPSPVGMTIGMPFFGQFIAHDQSWMRDAADFWLVEPFVFAAGADQDGLFHNRKAPGFDLDQVYEFGPVTGLGQPEGEHWWDESGLRFRFGVSPVTGRRDFLRNGQNRALMGDPRDDENGVVGQIHLAFATLHNRIVDEVIVRDGIDLDTLEFDSDAWWAVFNEARNFTISYYQGIVANEYATLLTGRSLFDAASARTEPIGPLEDPFIPLEFGAGVFRQHTLIPDVIQIGPSRFVAPIDPVLRHGLPWPSLFGSGAPLASRFDLAHAPALRDIVNLVVPGSPIPITMDLAQVNILRGREMRVPSGEEYLAMLITELGHAPDVATIRGKTVLTPVTARLILDERADADLLADLDGGDTDLHAYILAEAQLNGGVLGPVGQDILERTWIGILQADDFSILGASAALYTPEQLAVFRSATMDGLLERILRPSDLDRDGVTNPHDLAMLLAAWGRPDPNADLNGDGIVDLGDLAQLLDEWGF
ncbi:MAG: hypothetical protein KDA25_02890 [Phycisphaerales bacterium]|nr:hypothetical protein [Phycisphaerales bacterium]